MRILVCVVVAAISGFSSFARADPDSDGQPGLQSQATQAIRLAIDLQSTNSCITKNFLAQGLEYWLLKNELSADLEFAVEAHGSEESSGLVAQFELRRGGEVIAVRTLSGANSCEELAEALVLTMAIAVDGSVLERASTGRLPRGEPPDDVTPSEAGTARAEPSRPGPEEGSRRDAAHRPRRGEAQRIVMEFDVGAFVHHGLIPALTGVFDLRLGMHRGAGVSTHVGAVYGIKQEFDVPPGRGAAAPKGGRLDVCWGVPLSVRWRATTCGTGVPLLVTLEGRESDQDESHDAFLLGVGAGAGLTYGVGAFFGGLGIGGLMHVVRPRLSMIQGREVVETGWPIASASLGFRTGFRL